MLENMVLRNVFGTKGGDVTGIGADYVTQSFVIFVPHQILFGRLNQKSGVGRACGTFRKGAYRVLAKT